MLQTSQSIPMLFKLTYQTTQTVLRRKIEISTSLQSKICLCAFLLAIAGNLHASILV